MTQMHRDDEQETHEDVMIERDALRREVAQLRAVVAQVQGVVSIVSAPGA